MGTSLIQIVFPNDAEALATGITVGQVGVGMPNYAIGALIALWFGTQSSNINLVQVLRHSF
jgi:hypothetical protein